MVYRSWSRFSLVSCDEQGPTSVSRLPGEAGSDSTALAFAASRRLEEPADVQDPEDEGQCSRSPGFWCQNQDGGNPNLTSEELEGYVADALARLAAVGVSSNSEELLSAVCDTRRQLFRHLAALALNLAAGFVAEDDPVTGEDSALVATVGDAFRKGAEVYLRGDAVSFDDRNEVKDVLDRINNNVNLANDCTPSDEEGEEDEDEETPPGTCGTASGAQITICHIPPGNPAARQTIRISPNAWPAHQAHGDTCGACGS